MILKDGVKVQIRLGYANNPDNLDTVFLGSIVEISPSEGGKILELVCQGYGAELEGVELGPLEDGPTTRGFDYFFGMDAPNYPPYCYIENDRVVLILLGFG